MAIIEYTSVTYKGSTFDAPYPTGSLSSKKVFRYYLTKLHTAMKSGMGRHPSAKERMELAQILTSGVSTMVSGGYGTTSQVPTGSVGLSVEQAREVRSQTATGDQEVSETKEMRARSGLSTGLVPEEPVISGKLPAGLTVPEYQKIFKDWGFSKISPEEYQRTQYAEGFVFRAIEDPAGKVEHYRKKDIREYNVRRLMDEQGITVPESFLKVRMAEKKAMDPISTVGAEVLSIEGLLGARTVLETGFSFLDPEGQTKAQALKQYRKAKYLGDVKDPLKSGVEAIKWKGVAMKGAEAGVLGSFVVLPQLLGGAGTSVGFSKVVGGAKIGLGALQLSGSVDPATKGSLGAKAEATIGVGFIMSGAKDWNKALNPKQLFKVEYSTGAKVVKKAGGKDWLVQPKTKTAIFQTKGEAEKFAQAVKVPKKFAGIFGDVKVSEYGGQKVTGFYKGDIKPTAMKFKIVKNIPKEITGDIKWSSKIFTQRTGQKFAFDIGQPYAEANLKLPTMNIKGQKILGEMGLRFNQYGVTTGGTAHDVTFIRNLKSPLSTKSAPKGIIKDPFSYMKSRPVQIFKTDPIVQLKNVPSGAGDKAITKAITDAGLFAWSQTSQTQIPTQAFANIQFQPTRSILSSTTLSKQLVTSPTTTQYKSPLRTMSAVFEEQKVEKEQEKDLMPEEMTDYKTWTRQKARPRVVTPASVFKFKEPIKAEPIIPLVILPPAELGLLFKHKKKKSQVKKQPKKYRFSMIASGFGIKSKNRKIKKKTLMGLGIRPIIV